MKVVILCGGKGTRIRDVAEDIPKPIIPIGRYPILWHIMKYYSTFGHTEFVLCLGHKGEAIKSFFLNYEIHMRDVTITLGTADRHYHTSTPEDGWRVTLAETGAEAQTGSRVRAIRSFVGTDDLFLLTYGDGVGNIDLDALVAFHRAHGRVMTVSGVRPPGRFGELLASDDGTVSEFNEKPQATAGLISGGFFVCDARLFDYLGPGDGVVLEQEPMRKLVAEKQLMVYRHDDFWHPMDTYRDYVLLNRLFEAGQAPWVVWS